MTAVLCFTALLPVHSWPAISAVACKKLRGKEAPRFVGPLSYANEFNGSNGPASKKEAAATLFQRAADPNSKTVRRQ